VKVAIVGGGIGGMTLALSLLDAGIADVNIYESAPRVEELGVGINVLPHAVRELSELGLLDDVSGVGISTDGWLLYSKHGQQIWSEPRGLAAGYRWPQLSIHRGQLLGVLHRAVRDRLGREHVHTGHHLVRFGQGTSGVWGECIERRSGASLGHIEADLLVGCDGVHSVVRRAQYPDEGPPKWNGITMWRGVTEAASLLSGRTMITAGYFGRHIVVYPISKAYENQGRALLNWNTNVKTADDQPMSPQDWDHTARLEDAIAPFASYVFDFLDVPALIRGAKVIYQYPMVDRDPLPTWNFGRVTLLGDAAHPMYPIGANGASQAIIDARVLAHELALQQSVEAAVAAYDAERRPATAAVVWANRGLGPLEVLQIVEHRAPNGFTNLDDIISSQELQRIATTYKGTAGFDAELLNNRPSLSVPR